MKCGAIKIPRPPSKLEEMFALHIFTSSLEPEDMPVREYRFSATRNWRFDFAWPSRKLAVECEGGTHGKSRHTSPKGYAKDCEKYNAAAQLGWKVLRFTGEQIRSLEALEHTLWALKRDKI